MDDHAKSPDLPSVQPPPQRTFIGWVRRLGIAGVLFFLIKGLLWILIPVLVAKGCW